MLASAVRTMAGSSGGYAGADSSEALAPSTQPPPNANHTGTTLQLIHDGVVQVLRTGNMDHNREVRRVEAILQAQRLQNGRHWLTG